MSASYPRDDSTQQYPYHVSVWHLISPWKITKAARSRQQENNGAGKLSSTLVQTHQHMPNVDEEDNRYQINLEAVLYRLRYSRYLLHIRASIVYSSIRCALIPFSLPGMLWENSGVVFRSSISARHVTYSRVVRSHFGQSVSSRHFGMVKRISIASRFPWRPLKLPQRTNTTILEQGTNLRSNPKTAHLEDFLPDNII